MGKLRLIYLGSKVWGHVGMQEILNHRDKYDIVGVFTNPVEKDSPDYEWFNGIVELAKKNNIEVFPTPNKSINSKENVELITKLKPDVLFSMGWNALICKAILSIAKVNLNVHGSLLPRYRGYNANNWSILNGEKKAGITAHEMVVKVDAGNIYSQKEVEIKEEDTIKEVHEKSLVVLPSLVAEALEKAAKGERGKPMEMKNASYYGRRRPEDGLIDWGKDADSICRLVRSVTHPYPGAFTYCERKKVYIWKVEKSELENYNGIPGQILVKMKKQGSVHVACGKDLVKIISVQEEGKEEMNAYEYLKGKDRLGMNLVLEIERLKKKIEELEKK